MFSFFLSLRNIFIFLISVCIAGIAIGQNLKELYTIVRFPGMPNQIKLDKKLKETSALVLFDEGLWTLNDSGNDPVLYKVDQQKGNIIQKAAIINVENNDWEALTQDKDFVYVGDFGNNQGKRQNLMIYIVDKQTLMPGNDTEVKAEIIRFSYSDQNHFSHTGSRHNFDCEAMVSYGDSLLLFTKNRANLETTLYGIPKIPGEYNLTPLSSFDVDGLVTGASLNPESDNLVLIGYKDDVPFVFVFSQFMGDLNTSGNIVRFDFVKLRNSQIEGVSWIDKENIIISTEKTGTYDQSLFRLNLKKIFNQSMLEWE